MRLTRDDLARLLPHAGAMVLLDAVVAYDCDRIHCLADPHCAANPLREDGALPAWCGIEYAAQAMAVHSGLNAGATTAPRRGYLALARDIVLARPTLDGLPGSLHIHAEKRIADSGRSQYQFHIESDAQLIVRGCLTVVLQ